ncbi:MAG TPA: RecQ family ATP-dependent DNA helicase [Anaerolineae bacterium]|nr:RecQ family ATP-dependent DNA helicase [Anaerolineae bacterium]HOQ98003.1 RecQ family ATP-dependent DNA helicase [Anaerolineae bacterium]HPL26680.1 RecQ family ATP-dependent DNA helicase [Anaerolineae bacterium]
MTASPELLLQTLRERFQLRHFRDGQLETLDAVLDGRHTLLVMPTGSGKSLCYQLPAVLDNEGVVLVISPLIALMQDQVRALERRGIAAAALHSLRSAEEQATILRRMATGLYRLVYVAPERLRSAAFTQALPVGRVQMLAVDEAHCISQWGHDFRPAYLEIHKTWEALGQPTVLATTATATPLVQDDILRQLHIEGAARVVTGFNRPNLFFEVRHAPDEDAKLEQLLAALPAENAGSTIVYAGTKRAAEELADIIGEVKGLAAAYYHGGVEPEVRRRVQARFMQNRVQVLVATNAFGLGVDKADVRAVIHWDIPGSPEAYYQEAGRAGRDGKPARCLLLYTAADRALQEWFINNDAPDADRLARLHEALGRAGVGRDGRRTAGEAELRRRVGLSDIKLRVGISLLQGAGVLDDQGRDGGDLVFTLAEGVPFEAEAIMARVERFRAHKRALLDEMIRYAETEGCRRRVLLGYFGDPDGAPVVPCCDNCAKG